MSQNTGQNIVNMITCRAGEHCMFRSFGMGGVVDEPNRITRNALQVDVNRWYPGVVVRSVDVKKASIDGHFEYKIDVRGV